VYEGKTIRKLKEEQEQIRYSNAAAAAVVGTTGAIDIITRYDIETSVQYLDGILLNQGVRHPNMPTCLSDCRILFITEPLELVQRSTAQNMDMQFHTARQRVELINAERDLIDKKIQCLLSSGANVIISTNAIDSISLNAFAKNGIMAFRHVRQDLFEKLARCSGATIIHSILNQITSKESFMGHASQVSIEEEGEGKYSLPYIHFTGLSQKNATIVLSAPTKHVLQYMYRALKNTCKVLQNAYEDCLIIPGGGSVDMALANYVRSLCDNSSNDLNDSVSKRICQGFASALEHAVPGNLCRNSGFNVYQALEQWKQELIQMQKINKKALLTINLFEYPFEFYDPIEKGIWDSLRVKIQYLYQCVDMVSTLLSIDYLVKAEDLRPHSSKSLAMTPSEQEEQRKQEDQRRQEEERRREEEERRG
jgi:chaperonin GroEL (HSP60 family)